MSDTLFIILVTVGAVALFVIGLSLTLMIKGHNIKSEIGDNENMRNLGIKCAAQQMREEERALMGGGSTPGCEPSAGCSPAGCGSCGGTQAECE